MAEPLDREWSFTFAPCCGLQRRIPPGTKPGEPFTLVPCPRCNATFYGRVHILPSDIDPSEPSYLVEQIPWHSPSRPATASSGPSD